MLVACAVCVGAFVGWQANGWRLSEQLTAQQAQHGLERLALQDKAAKDLRHMEATKNAVLQQAQSQAAKNAAALADARAAAERLRGSLQDAGARISAASRPAVDAYAATVTELFSQCTTEVTELARAADGHALDASTCTAAWPVVEGVADE